MFWEPGMCPPGSKRCAGKSDSLASAAAGPPAAPKVIPAWKSSPSVLDPRLRVAAPRLPAAQGVQFRLGGGAGGSRGMAPLCLRSAFPPRPRANGQTRGAAGAGSRGSCQRQVQGLLRVGLVCELARLGSCMDYSCWHPGKSLTAQRAAARQRNGSSLQPGALERQQRQQKPGWCWSSRPAPEPAGSVGRSLPAITEQLFHEAAAPGGPGAALLRAGPAQPICCRRNLDLLRGRRNPRRRGCAQALPRALPAKCCNPCAAIPAWCCDTDAGSEIQAPASSHSRGRCSSLARSGSRSRGLVRAQPRLFLAPLGERENAAGRAEL